MSAPVLTRYVNDPTAVSGDQLNTFIQSCDNAIQMRALVGTVGLQLYTRGISAPADGLGGHFFWDATANGPDDGVNIIKPPAAKQGAWVRLDQASGGLGSPEIIFTNVASLRAFAGAINARAQTAFLLGYYVAGDDGGGRFFYLAGSSATDNNGTIIVDATGRRWMRVFTDTVSVLQFGAHGDGVTDDAYAFRYALAAGVARVSVPGYGRTYLFASTQAAPVAALLPCGVLIENTDNFELCGVGQPVITLADAVAASEGFIVHNCDNWTISGLTMKGNRNGLTAGVENPGFALNSCTNFVCEHLHFIGNYGGEGSMFCGDWLMNGTWRDIRGEAIGIGFDMAFMWNCTFDNISAVGADTNGHQGPGQIGDRFWSNVYDIPSLGNNVSGLGISDTTTIRIVNCYATNFSSGILLGSGTDYHIEGCRMDSNPGAGAITGNGILILYFGSGNFSSVGHPVKRVYINDCQLTNNGAAAVQGSGLYIDGSAINNGDEISEISIQNCGITGNKTYGVAVNGPPPNTTDLTIRGNLMAANGSGAVSPAILTTMVTSAMPFGCVFEGNHGYVNGVCTQDLPVVLGSGGTIWNVFPFSVTVTIYNQTVAYNVFLQPPLTAPLVTLATNLANTGGFTFKLWPGWGVYFTSAIPNGWVWIGDTT